MSHERITLRDNAMSSIMKLAEGNPGAIRVCTELLLKSKAINPDAALGEVANLLGLDTLGIYGSRIWMLYKDVCKEDIAKVVGVLRANQLGFMTKAELGHAIDNYGEGIDIDSLLSKVKERLPNFNLELESVNKD